MGSGCVQGGGGWEVGGGPRRPVPNANRQIHAAAPHALCLRNFLASFTKRRAAASGLADRDRFLCCKGGGGGGSVGAAPRGRGRVRGPQPPAPPPQPSQTFLWCFLSSLWCFLSFLCFLLLLSRWCRDRSSDDEPSGGEGRRAVAGGGGRLAETGMRGPRPPTARPPSPHRWLTATPTAGVVHVTSTASGSAAWRGVWSAGRSSEVPMLSLGRVASCLSPGAAVPAH